MFVYILVRFIHIIASVCWAGGAAIHFLFVEPTAKALAPDGHRFVQHMVEKQRFAIFMVINSTLTVLSGAYLIWRASAGSFLDYARSGPGLVFTIGAMAGIAVYFVGMLGVNPRAIQMSKLGKEIQSAGGPPSPDLLAKMHKLDREMAAFSLADFLLVALSLALMASARFIVL